MVKNSKEKWPLLIDQNDLASTFLRYRDTNYMNCLDVQTMKSPEKFRLGLLGAIRYGKPFIIDLMQYDQELIESVRTVSAQIETYNINNRNLFDDFCNKKLLEKENYLKLVKIERDGKEYEAHQFNKTRLDNFKVIFITSNPYPSKLLLKLSLPIKIVSAAGKSKADLYDF